MTWPGGWSGGNQVQEAADVVDTALLVENDDVEADDDGFGTRGTESPLEPEPVVMGVDLAHQ